MILLALVQFGFLVGSYAIGIFLPLMLREGKLTDVEIGFVSSGCYVVAVIGMILWARHVDRGASKVVNLALVVRCSRRADSSGRFCFRGTSGCRWR